MARSDLLVSLVRAAAEGNSRELAKTVETIIAEERAKQHNILADRLLRALRANGSADRTGLLANGRSPKAREYVLQTTPTKQFDDLFLPPLCELACHRLVEEQHRADLLRARHRALATGGQPLTTIVRSEVKLWESRAKQPATV